MEKDELLSFLQENGIAYQQFDHPAVFTCEEAKSVTDQVPGIDLKNLFLRDDKGKRHFLLAVRSEKRVNLKMLGSNLGIKGLGFASPERLKRHLQLDPGAVTVLGIINDRQRTVELLIDQEVWSEEQFQVHPLVNTSTLVIGKEGLDRFFQVCGRTPQIVSVPVVE